MEYQPKINETIHPFYIVFQDTSGHILESKGNTQYYCKRKHLDLLFSTDLSNTSVLNKNAHFSLILLWAVIKFKTGLCTSFKNL